MPPTAGVGFVWIDVDGRPALRCEALQQLADHFFTTRPWLLGSADVNAASGWRQVARAVGVADGHLVRAHQVHGASVVVVRGGDMSGCGSLSDADILLTADPSVAIAVQTADCVPILIADPRTRSVAAAHAGWRGLAARVPQVTVDAIGRELGARPADLVAAIGPAISGRRYEVGADVRERFAQAAFRSAQLTRWFGDGRRAGHWQFDGPLSAKDQLIEAGVPAAQVFVSPLCTATHADLLCSYRRDGRSAGRTVAVIRPRYSHPRARRSR